MPSGLLGEGGIRPAEQWIDLGRQRRRPLVDPAVVQLPPCVVVQFCVEGGILQRSDVQSDARADRQLEGDGQGERRDRHRCELQDDDPAAIRNGPPPPQRTPIFAFPRRTDNFPPKRRSRSSSSARIPSRTSSVRISSPPARTPRRAPRGSQPAPPWSECFISRTAWCASPIVGWFSLSAGSCQVRDRGTVDLGGMRERSLPMETPRSRRIYPITSPAHRSSGPETRSGSLDPPDVPEGNRQVPFPRGGSGSRGRPQEGRSEGRENQSIDHGMGRFWWRQRIRVS